MDCELQSSNSFPYPFPAGLLRGNGLGKLKVVEKQKEQMFQDTIKFGTLINNNQAPNEENTRKTPFFPYPKLLSSQKILQKQYEATENKRVEQIIAKDSLRLRLKQLLPDNLFLPIGFNGQQLLKFMQLIDKTIQFLTTHRRMKHIFFQSLKRSIFDNSSIVIQLKYIQQILFLDQSYYLVEWGINQNLMRYDLKVGVPRNQAGVEWRKSNLRKKIVKYLQSKEQQFLLQNSKIKRSDQAWHEQFKYDRIQIPLKELHLKPKEKNSENAEKIDGKKDTKKQLVRGLIKGKNAEEEKSITSSHVAAMIFSKKSASQISSIVIEAIKQKQKKVEEQKARMVGNQEEVDKKELLKIFEEIYRIFIFKKVSNIFKMTILDILREKFNLKDDYLIKCIETLLTKREVNCLKLVQSSSKAQVIQIDKQKYKQFRQFLLESDNI